MANEQNLIPNSERSPKEVRENGRKGGINSGKARRRKKTVQETLNILFDSKCSSMPQFQKIAEGMGIKDNKSIKELYVTISVLKSLKKGSIDDLMKITDLLGEQTVRDDNNDDVKETLIKIRECAFEHDNRTKP